MRFRRPTVQSIALSNIEGAVARRDAILRDATSADLPYDRVFLYGSVARHLITGEQWADINLALSTSWSDADRIPTCTGAIAVVDGRWPSPASLFRLCDFTVAEAVVHGDRLYFGDRFFEHLAVRSLVTTSSDVPAAVTLLRTFKLRQRGYTLSGREGVRLLSQQAVPLSFAGVDVVRHSGGSVVGRQA